MTFKNSSQTCFLWEDTGNLTYLLTTKKIPTNKSPVCLNESDIIVDCNSVMRDLLKRHYEVNCSGKRGNVCDGEVTYTLKVIDRCNECQIASYNAEKCTNLTEQSCGSASLCSNSTHYNTSETGDRIASGICNGGVCTPFNSQLCGQGSVCYPGGSSCVPSGQEN